MNMNRSVVLVVGPDSRWRPLIAALERYGYETLAAQDGFGALRMAIEHDVDLLITDDEMPGLTGCELIGIVRKHGAVSHCLLISDSDQASPTGCTESTDGKAGFLVAPFDPEQVLLKVREICEVFPAAPILQLN